MALRGDNKYPPNHFIPESPTNHFLGYCGECNAHLVAAMTLEQVDNWFRMGLLSEDEWWGYTWAWAISAFRYGNYREWERVPESLDARHFGLLVMEAARRLEERRKGREKMKKGIDYATNPAILKT